MFFDASDNCTQKDTLKTQSLLFYVSIALARYFFIFWLKNPLAVEEDFWSLFVSMWIVLASAINNFVYGFLPGPQPLPYYTCADINPANDLKLPKKQEGFVLMVSVILLLYINLRIYLTRNIIKLRKIFRIKPNVVVHEHQTHESNNTIIDWATLLWILILFLLFFTVSLKVNSIRIDELNLYPNYLLVYFQQIIAFQIFSFLLLSMLYSRHKEMLKTLFIALKGQN